MLIIRAQLLVGDALHDGRARVVALSDVNGYLVRVRQEDTDRPVQTKDAYQGLVLRDAMASFNAVCREQAQRLGTSVHLRANDPAMDRWLDRLAAIGELPTAERPRPWRSVPASPTWPLKLSPPAAGWVWQAYPDGSRAVLVAPTAGPAVLSIWQGEDDRPADVVSATSRQPDSALLSGSARVPHGSTIEGVLVGAPGESEFVALDLMRYRGEVLIGQPLAARAALLEQMWGELVAAGGVPGDWRLAALSGPPRSGESRVWRVLAAPYGAPGSWGLELHS